MLLRPPPKTNPIVGFPANHRAHSLLIRCGTQPGKRSVAFLPDKHRPSGVPDMKIASGKAAEFLEALRIQDEDASSLNLNQAGFAKSAKRAIHVNHREARRISEFLLCDRQFETIVLYKTDRP